MDKPVALPLDAIGALELGQTVEAIRIVRQAFGIEADDARILVEEYSRLHPPAPDSPALTQGLPLWLTLAIASVGIILLAGYFVLV